MVSDTVVRAEPNCGTSLTRCEKLLREFARSGHDFSRLAVIVEHDYRVCVLMSRIIVANDCREFRERVSSAVESREGVCRKKVDDLVGHGPLPILAQTS